MRRLPALLLLLITEGAAAQTIRGTVHDSTSRMPVPGTIVLTLDSTRAPIARTITNVRGEYELPRTPQARILRTLRLGFRPVELDIRASASPTVRMDVTIMAVPVTLETVKTLAAASCPKRRDTQAAFSLLEQVRSGLLATVVARESKPAVLSRLAVIRTRHLETDKVLRMSVAMDSAETTNSYSASMTARDFIENGFAKDSSGILVAYGPDAEVLMDEAFANGYCFRIMDHESTRPHQVGLGFSAAETKRGRIDIDGALWVDTTARTLVDIEFLFRGFDRRLDRARPGGHVEFRAMANGVTIIDRWSMRIPNQEAPPKGQPIRIVSGFRAPETVIRETGGELAHARWDDGTAFDASLGSVKLHLDTRSGLPDTARVVQLDSTTWVARTDSAGNVEFTDLPPGPYAVSLVDPRLMQLGVGIPTGATFDAQRDSVVKIRVNSVQTEDLVKSMCKDDKASLGTAMVIGRILEADGTPANRVDISIDRAFAGKGTERVGDGGQTGSDGLFRYCALERGWFIVITVHRGDVKRVVELPNIPEGLSVLQFKLQRDPQ